MNEMDLDRPWSPGDTTESEDEHLAKYHQQRGGLLFAEVNVAFPVTGSRQRRLDGVLFPNPPKGKDGEAYNYTPSNRPQIRELIQTRTAELIEVHSWGFYGFGQIVGKNRIVQKEWDLENIRKVSFPTTMLGAILSR